MKKSDVAVIIPALNEAASIAKVLSHIPESFRHLVIVADNGSTDGTDKIAKDHGACVVTALTRGYGSACLAGIAFAQNQQPDIYVFLDADYSDYPEDMSAIVDELLNKNLDLVIGSRTLGLAESGSLLPQARFGNWLATHLMYLRFGHLYSDLGPFRAIRANALEQLHMQDKNFGWTVEMQIKALKQKLRVGEVSVRYRKRIGISKITGTLKGTVLAGIKILLTIARYGIGPE
jgi:glycosyltransferase involved in cell wall biosynthesis